MAGFVSNPRRIAAAKIVKMMSRLKKGASTVFREKRRSEFMAKSEGFFVFVKSII